MTVSDEVMRLTQGIQETFSGTVTSTITRNGLSNEGDYHCVVNFDGTRKDMASSSACGWDRNEAEVKALKGLLEMLTMSRNLSSYLEFEIKAPEDDKYRLN